jgi:hypothetical protein
VKLHESHVRLSVGQTVYYTQFPDRSCEIIAVHDAMTPVLYDIRIPSVEVGGLPMIVHNVFPRDVHGQPVLRAVDVIAL